MYQRQSKKYSRRNAATWRKPVVAILGLAVLIAGTLTVLALTDTFPFRKAVEEPEPSTANSETKGEQGNVTQPTNDETPQSQDGTGSSDNKDRSHADQTTTGTAPKKPDGNFVSAHKVSLSTNPSLQSSCTTTAGATCQVLFSKDGVTKSLEAKTTDAGGGAYWSWKLQDVGLTVGSWKIQLKSTIGDKTATAEDSLALEISP